LWFERVLMPLNVRHVAGPRRVAYAEDELVVVCLAKNAERYVDTFVSHYLQMGVRHIVLLDNDSDDDTVAQAARHPRVSVFRTTLSFRGNNCAMRRYLLRRFGAPGHWVLCVDVDELFDYPDSERVDLASLLRYLRSKSYTAMVAYLLDMLSDKPVSHRPPAGLSLKDAYPFYDTTAVRKLGYFEEDGYGGQRFVSHNALSNPAIGRYVGGIRAQAFDLPHTYLIKHPLTLADGRVRLTHQHFVDHAHVADITGVLYHYKFVDDFRAKAEAAVRASTYADDSYEYRHYLSAVEKDPDLCLKHDTAKRLRGVGDLVEEGFLHVTQGYSDWAERSRSAGGQSVLAQ
jgi:glycosyltransferase involved in cell wall biosynthesis